MNAIRADDNLLRFDYPRIINESQNHHTNNKVFDLLQVRICSKSVRLFVAFYYFIL